MLPVFPLGSFSRVSAHPESPQYSFYLYLAGSYWPGGTSSLGPGRQGDKRVVMEPRCDLTCESDSALWFSTACELTAMSHFLTSVSYCSRYLSQACLYWHLLLSLGEKRDWDQRHGFNPGALAGSWERPQGLCNSALCNLRWRERPAENLFASPSMTG